MGSKTQSRSGKEAAAAEKRTRTDRGPWIGMSHLLQEGFCSALPGPRKQALVGCRVLSAVSFGQRSYVKSGSDSQLFSSQVTDRGKLTLREQIEESRHSHPHLRRQSIRASLES